MCVRISGLLIVACLALSGCSTVDVGDISQTIPKKVTFACKPSDGMSDMDVKLLSLGQPPALPGELQSDDLSQRLNDVVGELTAAHNIALAEGMSAGSGVAVYSETGDEADRKIEVSLSDIDDFADAVSQSALQGIEHVYESSGDGMSKETRQNLLKIFRDYYGAYLKGDYVTRYGSKLSKPEISAHIGNETITAVVNVFMDAWLDIAFRTPIFKGKNEKGEIVYYPAQGKNQPTASRYKVVPTLDIASDSRLCGVTDREAKAIAWLTGIAGDQSAVLSGLLLESFGGLEVSLVLGGHFSIGDNETLAAIAKVFVEVADKQIAEYAAYKFFWHLAYTAGDSGQSDDEATQGMADGAVQLFLVDELNQGMSASGADPKLQSTLNFLSQF